jgi:hypothetical protein
MGTALVPRAWVKIAATSPLLLVLANSGCTHALIQSYAIRQGEVVFVVQDGTSYQLGDCKRGPDGQLSGCRTYDVVFH